MSALTIAGISIHRDVDGRFSLNDLHRAAGGEGRHRPSLWRENQQAKDLIAEVELEAGIPALVSIKGGAAGGTYAAKELVYAYAMWISAAFHLKVIRAYDAMVTAAGQPSGYVGDGCALIESVSRTLHLAPSATLGMYHRLADKAGHVDLLPAYAVDSSTNDGGGSSEPTMALSALLADCGIGLSAQKVNALLEKAGLLETLSRRSSKGGEKKFKCLTKAGLQYGKNVTSPQNARETQPHFYVSEFPQLLEVIGLSGLLLAA